MEEQCCYARGSEVVACRSFQSFCDAEGVFGAVEAVFICINSVLFRTFLVEVLLRSALST
jgi:hypothetical protein